jgi:hypothetical protein
MRYGPAGLVIDRFALLAELCFPLKGDLLAVEIGEDDLHHGFRERVEINAL